MCESSLHFVPHRLTKLARERIELFYFLRLVAPDLVFALFAFYQLIGEYAE
jgi:hypothetical protein